jgi:hypothetical protein
VAIPAWIPPVSQVFPILLHHYHFHLLLLPQAAQTARPHPRQVSQLDSPLLAQHPCSSFYSSFYSSSWVLLASPLQILDYHPLALHLPPLQLVFELKARH